MIFDAHSDALYDVINDNHTWNFHLQEMNDYYGAIINYYFKGDETNEHFINVLNKIAFFYEKEFYQYEKLGFILGIEGLGPVNKLTDIDYLKNAQIKSVTLTWNDENLLATGTFIKSKNGLKEFGKQVLDRLYEYGIMLDLSHANEKTFFEVIEYYKGKVFVSHANTKAVWENQRNLSDKQILAIKARNGVIGINVYKEFVGNEKCIYDVVNHIDHLINIAGEDVVCLGLDLDYYLPSVTQSGAIESLKYPQDIKKLIKELELRGYKEETIKKISFKNIIRFIESSLIL